MGTHIQTTIQVRMKGLDDVFHRTIIALERLEMFLEIEKNQEAKDIIEQTAIKTDRDQHDDEKNPPNRELLFGEVQLQCSALYFQTKFDDKEMFEKTVRYFLNDLLEWYGGRGEQVEPNEVENFFLPIVVSISRQITSVADIMEAVEKYVGKIKGLEDYSDEEKELAVIEGFKAFVLADHNTKEANKAFEESGEDVVLTSHKRGDSIDGYKRLYLTFCNVYEDAIPVKLLVLTISNYLPELAEQCPEISNEAIDTFFEEKNKQ